MSGYRFRSFIYSHPKKCHRRDQLQQIAIPVSTPSNWGFQLISNSDYEKKVAVALLYDRIKAPTLVAKGEGGLANQILAEAESAGVPVSQDELLANTLAQLSLNEEIPEALFQSVAIVLAWAYRIQGKTPWD